METEERPAEEHPDHERTSGEDFEGEAGKRLREAEQTAGRPGEAGEADEGEDGPEADEDGEAAPA